MKKIFLFLSVLVLVLMSSASYAQDTLQKVVQEAFENFSVANYADAAPLFEEAYEILKDTKSEDLKGLYKIALYAGLSKRSLGEYEAAYSWFDNALSIAEKLDKSSSLPLLYGYLAEAKRMEESYSTAIRLYKKALSYSDINEKDLAALYYGLAESYRLKGDYEDAFEACQKFDKSTSSSLEFVMLSCNVVEGEIYRSTGDYANALKSFGAALDTARARKYVDIQLFALNGLAVTSEKLGRNDIARGYYEDALNVSLKNSFYDNVEFLSAKISSMLPASARLGGFESLGDKVVKFADAIETSDDNLNFALWHLASDYYRVSSKYSKMFSLNEKVYKRALEVKYNKGIALSLYGMAQAEYNLARYSSALDYAARALREAKNNSDDKLVADINILEEKVRKGMVAIN